MRKSIKSRDGKIEVRYDEVTHVCIAPNIYPLLQYLLLMDDDVVFHHTCYFVNEVSPDSVRSKLPSIFFNNFGRTIREKIQRRITKMYFCLFKYVRWPFLKTANFYALDSPYLNLLIGKRNYSLLADGPNWLTLNMQEHSLEYVRQHKRAESFLGKVQRIFYGNAFFHYWGNNEQCKAVFLTEENVSPVLQGKKVYINSLDSLWKLASEKKKQYIMQLFELTSEDIRFLNSRPNIFFTQRLVNDCGLTEEECFDLLSKIFQKYPPDSLIIKTHFKDCFDYKKFFPNIAIFSKPVNSQLLYIMGVTPQKVITIASTAIECFPDSVECDYYGTSSHPKIEEYLGKDYLPKRKVNFVNLE